MGYLEENLRYFFYVDLVDVPRITGTTQMKLLPNRMLSEETCKKFNCFLDENSTGTKEWFLKNFLKKKSKKTKKKKLFKHLT